MNRYFVISDNKTDSQKYLLQHHEWTAEIGSHRPWLLIYHAMQYTGNAWVLCTRAPRRAFPDLLFSSNLNREAYCMNCTPLYGSSLCIMRWGCSGCASDWDKSNGVCQNPEHWSVCKKLCLEDQHKTQHTGLDFCTRYVNLPLDKNAH